MVDALFEKGNLFTHDDDNKFSGSAYNVQLLEKEIKSANYKTPQHEVNELSN